MRSGITRLVLVGAGPAHLAVLGRLAAHHPGDLQVTLLTRWPHHTPAALLPTLMAGGRTPEQARIALPALLQSAHARALAGHCIALNAEARQLTWQPADGSAPQTLDFDLLSLDPAAALDRERLNTRWPGAREHALALWPLEGLLALWPGVLALAQRQPVSLAVIGGNTAAVEAAFAAAERLRRDGAPGSTFTLVTGGPEPAAELPARARQRVRQRLRRAGIQVLCEPCTGFTAEGVRLGNGALLRCDVPLLACPGDAPAWLADSGLALGDTGRVRCDDHGRSLSHPAVFASGEAAERGVHAPDHDALAPLLLAAHAGTPLKARRPPRQPPTLVACGEHHALAVWGPWVLQGAWVRRWRERRDQRALDRHARPAP
ncbi:MAG: FAD-dependent oxidoreductase [Hydrogenophaga sp.]|uniref:NAD(P)/FAD-dependent oxidoreductase n=1 Tax=Hydrogenophaga sp. TaxID=1904254 RepID=UPI00257FCE99|nr:FAD-dependent oxidoreductase [Hydrogenophaga sp.]MBL0944264.1 FAD-dependent oxidoreductase [Hydrogenophaga sp.]